MTQNQQMVDCNMQEAKFPSNRHVQAHAPFGLAHYAQCDMWWSQDDGPMS